MSDVFYTPPAADLRDSPNNDSPFFTVSVTKLTVMLIMTSGLYALYWGFKNWSHYKAYSGRSIWPVPRTLFWVFYLPSLFRKIDAVLSVQGKGRLSHWALLASGIIILALAPAGIGFLVGVSKGLAGETYTGMGIIPTLALPATTFLLQCLILLRVQSFINLANGDPEGRRNNHFTRWNVLWMVIGVIYWIAGIAVAVSMSQSSL